MTQDEMVDLLRESGAMLQGHFLLSSGMHSDRYIEKFRLLERPEYTERCCRELARRFGREKPQVVIGPTTGGVILAYETARILGVRGIFAEREGEARTLRRGFSIEPGERVLLVDDVMTRGGSVREMIDLIRRLGGDLVGIGLLVDRSSERIDFGVRTEALCRLRIEAWDPAECPQCAAGVPLTERGSRRL